ncbi:NDP-sugar synthase [Nanoarchaeota archaeon]
MKAVIIAGGLGTRLKPLTDEMPKALIDINGKTLTEHVIDVLKKLDINEVYLSIGYMADKIKEYFDKNPVEGIKINYLIEEDPLGTGGWLNIVDKTDFQETFMVVNGDNLFDLDLKKMLQFHDQNKATITIALTAVEDPSQYGVVELDGERITSFVEKPNREEAPSNLISSGYYIFEPKVFEYAEELKRQDKKKIMLETDIFPAVAKDHKLFAFEDKGRWFDTGTLERYEQVKKEWKRPAT